MANVMARSFQGAVTRLLNPAGQFLQQARFHGPGSSCGLMAMGRSRLKCREVAWRTYCFPGMYPGSKSYSIEGMEAKIKEHLNADEVVVKDTYGDGRHVSIEVVAQVFDGVSALNRQRMVYKVIWEELQDAIHAVDELKTQTPGEALKL